MGVIVAGFTALGKTTLAQKYENIVDLESSLYQWEQDKEYSLNEIEKNKGKEGRIPNKEFPLNYIEAIFEATKHYNIVLTSMHWLVIDYFIANNVEFYLAYPTLDSGDVIKQRCVDRGNAEWWAQKIKEKVVLWHSKLKEYNLKNIIWVSKDETLENALKRVGILK